MMQAYSRSRWYVLSAVAALTLSSFTAHGDSITQAVGETRTQLMQFCRTNNLRTSQQRGLLHISLKGNSPAIREGYLNACGPNVVEFFKTPNHGTFHHLYTRVGGDTYSRIWGLYKSSWYPASGEERVGVLCQLTSSEMRNFQAFLAENHASPTNKANPHGTIGEFDVYGGGANTTHCTNYLDNSKGIGANGESLPQLFGRYSTGIAPSWISGLINSDSPRIIGVAIHDSEGSTSDLSRFFN